MKTKLIFTTLILLLVSIQSCKKNDVTYEKLINSDQTDIAQVKFAKILAPALANSYELRKFLKAEALKQFDKDYDILYQLIRNKKVGDITVSELLSSYAESKEDFASIENNFPLLTILIPTVPNFTPENWNVSTEIPQVAVALSDKKDVPMYDKSGKATIVPSGCVPTIPVVVVKQNERVVVSQGTSLKSQKISVNGNSSFSFVDEAFDGTNTTKLKRTALPSDIDPIIVEAYNLGMEWQRDHVYYGLTPTNTQGSYRNNYSEFLTSFRFLEGPPGLYKIMDQQPDPGIPTYVTSTALIFDGASRWTNGFFEFKVTVVINGKNGVGQTLTKGFSARGSDLFDITYGHYILNICRIVKIAPKTYNPNLELIPWDLESYGTAWKFIISEFDVSEEVTQTVENTTTYAGNFEFNTKFGLKFGASATTSEKNTFSIKSYLSSDELYEAVLTFDQPIIIGVSNGVYTTREISTGWVSIGVEPKRIF